MIDDRDVDATVLEAQKFALDLAKQFAPKAKSEETLPVKQSQKDFGLGLVFVGVIVAKLGLDMMTQPEKQNDPPTPPKEKKKPRQ